MYDAIFLFCILDEVNSLDGLDNVLFGVGQLHYSFFFNC